MFKTLSKEYWRRVLPAWPVVPAQLWLTGAGAMLAVLSLVFRREIWSAHVPALEWSWVTLVVMVQAAGVQLIKMMFRWLNTYVGPGWMRLIMHWVAWTGSIGIALLMVCAVLFSYLPLLMPMHD